MNSTCLSEIDVREMSVHSGNPMAEEHYRKMKDVSNRRHENDDEQKALLDATEICWLNVLTRSRRLDPLLEGKMKQRDHRTE